MPEEDAVEQPPELEVSNYQLRWEDCDKVLFTNFIAADEVSIGDMYEFWLNGQIVMSIREENVIMLRNLTALADTALM